MTTPTPRACMHSLPACLPASTDAYLVVCNCLCAKLFREGNAGTRCGCDDVRCAEGFGQLHASVPVRCNATTTIHTHTQTKYTIHAQKPCVHKIIMCRSS